MNYYGRTLSLRGRRYFQCASDSTKGIFRCGGFSSPFFPFVIAGLIGIPSDVARPIRWNYNPTQPPRPHPPPIVPYKRFFPSPSRDLAIIILYYIFLSGRRRCVRPDRFLCRSVRYSIGLVSSSQHYLSFILFYITVFFFNASLSFIRDGLVSVAASRKR